MTRRKGKRPRCLLLILTLLLLGTWFILKQTEDSRDWAHHGPYGPHVISRLRGMMSEVLLLRADSWDEVALWAALPDGVTSVDAPARYLAPYSDYSEAYSLRGHPYRFEIVSDDQDIIWRVGYDLSKVELTDWGKEGLEKKAERVGLVNAEGEPYTSLDAVIYMLAASFDLGLRGQ